MKTYHPPTHQPTNQPSCIRLFIPDTLAPTLALVSSSNSSSWRGETGQKLSTHLGKELPLITTTTTTVTTTATALLYRPGLGKAGVTQGLQKLTARKGREGKGLIKGQGRCFSPPTIPPPFPPCGQRQETLLQCGQLCHFSLLGWEWDTDLGREIAGLR